MYIFRCEVRPGPEFLLRKYKFKNSHFVLRQYYYEDPGCTRHSYGVVAEGDFKLLQKSWMVPGGTEARYTVRNVSIIPYSREKTKIFQKMSSHCSKLSGILWKPYRKYKILNFPPSNHYRNKDHSFSKDFDCSNLFNASFHELQLMRVEIHRQRSYKSYRMFRVIKHRKARKVKELYLGDIHTDIGSRRSYRPTSYQQSLRSSSTVCITDAEVN